MKLHIMSQELGQKWKSCCLPEITPPHKENINNMLCALEIFIFII